MQSEIDNQKSKIVASLAGFKSKDLKQAAIAFLNTLGYRSEKVLDLENTPAAFLAQFDQRDRPLRKDKALFDRWKSVDFLFQLTDDEIRSAGGQNELAFDSSAKVDYREIHSYLILALDLKPGHYTRTGLATITREINRLFDMPTLILFRYGLSACHAQAGDLLTFSVIDRRIGKRDESQNVLEKVKLIKDIRYEAPHRAHTEILHDLSLPALMEKHECRDFKGLHEAWRKTLDTNELNKRFYRELADWYFWALGSVEFPDDLEKDKATRNATSVIRLLTRLIFCWFIKEKGLIPNDLFNETKLQRVLKSLKPEDQSFYRAILQNLFFGTLNQRMNVGAEKNRKFAREGSIENQRDEYGVKNLYRYKDLFAIPEEEAVRLFEDIPFLNGGLFDCLDKEDESGKNKVLYVDGFSRNPRKQPKVPNFLFFSDYRMLDLSDAYNDTKRKKEKVRGLINLLDSYKFTVTENTPIEEEIALDPELLGKVFENLLASYNPETGTTARKQTGSFYTPREIVNYMVDESLIAYLKGKIGKGDTDILVCGLHQLQAGMPVSPSITRRNLPHWSREGSIYWITFRLADALPREKLRAWKEERNAWLESHNEPWSEVVWKEYDERFGRRLEEWLDAGLGSRALARPDVRNAVKECLLRFNGDRLRLHAAVIMPTHVHVLLEPLGNNELSDILKGIKGAGAWQANKLLGQSGTFWLDESYDHIVRSPEQYRHFLDYMEKNPVKAGLQSDEYWLYQGDTGIPACNASAESTDKNVCATLEARLRQLFAYTDKPHPFAEKEIAALVDAVDTAKILDPACGSGAFPMGILHKLVFILGKLDHGNERWKRKQIDKLDSASMREELEQTFRNNDDDFGRKLCLIENCIYGVDIQPIAIQISKLRFFISLICDQRTNKNKAQNCGVRPLPNLETKFVAANTLIALEKQDGFLKDQRLVKLEKDLESVRHKHFSAQRRRDKLDLQKRDRDLRQQIAAVLKDGGMSSDASRKLAAWDPYDQNASSPFFDPEWMFGVRDGFDVVIGNPPWGIPMTTEEKMRFRRDYVVAQGILDSYALFIEHGDRLLNNRGVLSMILPDIVLLKAYPLTRKYLLDRYVINWAVFWGSAFDAVNLDTCTIIASKEDCPDKRSAHLVKAITDVSFLDIRQLTRNIPQHVFEKAPDNKFNLFWSKESEALESKIERHTQPFCELFHSHEGIHSGNIRDKLFGSSKRGNSCRPLIFGRDEIKPFGLVWAGRYVRYTEDIINKAKGEYANLAKEAYFTQPKLFVRRTGDFVMAAVDRKQYFASNNLFVCVPRTACDLDYLAAILNSRLMTWYFRCIQPRVGRLFAELKIVHLNTFPICAAGGALQNQLSSLAKKLKAAAENGITGDTAVLREELNTLVYQAYELDRKDIEQIEEATG